MQLLINPGFQIGAAGPDSAWTNTFAKARSEAEAWLGRMRNDNLADIVLLDPDGVEQDGRTVGEWIGPHLLEAYSTGQMPALLPGPHHD
jgi:hypothetical protein